MIIMNYLYDKFIYENNIEIVGLTSELNAFYILNYLNNNNDNVLIVTNTLYEANKYFNIITTYTDNCLLFPMDDFISSVALAVSPEFKIKRLETLNKLTTAKKSIVITNLMGLLHFLPNKSKYNNLSFILKKGLKINRDKLISVLEELGYNKDVMTSSTGEYAVRGFIIDIFIIDGIHPVRVEFFGDEIESIRYFDENTQLSINEVNEIECLPYKEIETDEKSNIIDYLNNPCVFFIEKDLIDSGYKKLLEDIISYHNENNIINKKEMFNLEDLNINKLIYLNNFKSNLLKTIVFDAKEIDNFNSNFKFLVEFVNSMLKKGKTVIFYLSNQIEINNIIDLFPNAILVSEDSIILKNINIINKKINKGFEFGDFIVISEYDIEQVGHREIKYKNTYKIGKKIRDFNDLNIGDYVVHQSHGIGIYNGVITLNKKGVQKDYLLINYAGNDKVYIPVEKISTIFKYSSKDGIVPKINKLNSTSWAVTKRNLQKKIKDISMELIRLYAERSKIKGTPYKTYELEEIFDNNFKYQPTYDQIKAFKDVDNDLKSEVPMDRLLCGDVGFGKTEVAFRGMFKTVVNNEQVAYLCPTTILSKQQYENAIERFKDFPVEIALINRFTNPKETKRIIDGLKSGKIDIVFGTHRLLSKDINYKKLGLLIIDEEQRFGVTHKERIKELKNDVNVLTLSATPIPRTLKMAMAGLRDLSIIDTAPVNRYPVQTYVIKEQDLIIKEAIYKELSRNGQLFILYNKVESIESKKDELLKLVPDARIVIAHGQMSKTDLENVMSDFVDYKYDILLCTTIIETGIDISNVNTLIIYDADRFGLSQLYQIRGRVGRSNKIAYAYLMYNKNKMLNDLAIKRLSAIKEFTELGSGYRIAMRDLALRGAGDILGSDQAGFVDAVGLDLYMKMIDDEVKRLHGEAVTPDDEAKESLINVDTHISDNYVADESLKIEIHKKINEIDSYDKLIEVQNEIIDRFGKFDEKLRIYMYEEWFEKLANILNISKVLQNEKIVQIEIPENIVIKLKFEKIFMEIYNICPKVQLKSFNKKVYITIPLLNLDKHFVYYLVDILNILINELEKNNNIE